MNLAHEDYVRLLAGIDPSWRLISVEPIAVGMLNKVARVHLEGARPASVVVRVRHFEDPQYGQEFAAERFVYPLLPTDRPARPYFYGIGHLGAHRAAVFEDVAGPSLDAVLQHVAVPGVDRRSLIVQLAEDLAVLHTRPAHGFGTPRRVDHAPDEVHGFWVKLFSAEVEALSGIAPQSVPALKDAMCGWLDVIAKAPHALVRPCLVHGDMHGRNVLVREGRCVLIDWEAARFRSPAYDLVQLHTLDLATRPDDAALLREVYLSRRGIADSEDALVRLVRAFTGFWKVRMAIFMVVHDRPGSAYFGRLEEWRAFLDSREFT